MAKCPKCKKEIDSLIEDRQQVAYYNVTLVEDKNGDGLDYNLNEYGDCIKSSFFCPECDKKLFNTEKQAIKFLKSKL